jgi:DNA-binding NtrC family response regulator
MNVEPGPEGKKSVETSRFAPPRFRSCSEVKSAPKRRRAALQKLQRQVTPWPKTEKNVIVDAVEKSKGNISLAGLLLGLGRTAMHRHLRKAWPDYRLTFPRKWQAKHPGN